MSDLKRVRVHVKNNHASPDTFPPTPEGEAVFTITPERWAAVAANYPDVAERVEVFIDWDEDNFATSMASAEVLVCWDLPTEGLQATAPRLDWIHIIGAGVEHLCPMNWLPSGVDVVNNRGVHAAKGGEWGLMAVLMLHNHMPAVVENQRRAHWESLYSTPIAGRTVLIVGTGSIGRGIAASCKVLGMHVVGVSRHGAQHDCLDEAHPVADLDRQLPRADFVVMVTPMTPETENLLDERRQGLMKPGAGLVNLGRAGTVDYQALRANLAAGQISGAVLDVFDPEPLPADDPLWSTPGVIVTPHISADDGDAYVETTLDLVFRNLRRYLAGEALENRVNPELGY